MTDRDIKPENCPLCRRPKWDGWGEVAGCDAGADWPRQVRVDALDDCRRIALDVAALVAPVVEAAEEILAGSVVDRDEDEAALAAAFDAMRDGLARLGKP